MRRSLCTLAVLMLLIVPLTAHAAPEGQVTSLQAVSIAPRWFDPADAEGIITPFIAPYEDIRLKGK